MVPGQISFLLNTRDSETKGKGTAGSSWKICLKITFKEFTDLPGADIIDY
jgi:hypothetical protein